MEEILLKLNRVKAGIEQKIDSLATGAIANLDSAFASWRVPWTADRAAKIDRLNVDVSTRSTQTSVNALSSNLATNAGKLDTLLGQGVVKRVIRGYVAYTHEGWTVITLNVGNYKQMTTQVTIPAVNMSKSMVLVDAFGFRGSNPLAGSVAAFLINATTLEIRLPDGALYGREVNYQVVEFY